MKNLYTLILLVFTLSLSLSAQKGNFSLSTEVGPAINYTSNGLSYGEHQEPNFGFGVGSAMAYHFTNELSLRFGLSYERTGSKTDRTHYDESGNALYTYQNYSHYNQIIAPVMLRLTVGKEVKFFANGGLYLGGLVSTVRSETTSGQPLYGSMNEKYTNSRGLAGTTLGCGVLFPINTNFLFSLELRNNYSMFIPRKLAYEQVDYYSNTTSLLLGMTINFGE